MEVATAMARWKDDAIRVEDVAPKVEMTVIMRMKIVKMKMEMRMKLPTGRRTEDKASDPAQPHPASPLSWTRTRLDMEMSKMATEANHPRAPETPHH
jgi:hypothetical protein